MNRIYRSVWNAALGSWVAVAEIARAHGKGGSAKRGAAVVSLLLCCAWLQEAGAATVSWDPNGAAAGTTPTLAMADNTTLSVTGSGSVQAGPAAQTVITGSAGANTVIVAAGATLRASGDLGDGNDVLDVAGTLDIGTAAGAVFSLGAGNDTFRVYDTTRVTGNIDAGAGNDTLDVTVSPGTTVPLGGLQGFESLGKSGGGTLQINGPGTFNSVFVNAGTLEVTPASGSGVAAQETVIRSGATLLVDAAYSGTAGDDTMTIAGTIRGNGTVNLGAGNDTLTLQDGADLSGLATPIDGGAGSNTLVSDIATSATLGGITNFQTLDKTNVGTLHVNGPAAASFNTVNVQGGTVSVGPQGSISGVASTSVAAGATLNVDGSYSGSAGADTVTMAGALSGAGSVALLDGNDRFELHDSGSIAAATRVDGGTGTNAFVLTGSATASFDASRLDHGIDNFQDLRKEGTGTWSLTGTGAPTQHWSIAEGTLIGDSQSLQGNIANQAALVFEQATDGAYAGTLSGGGTLTKSGAGMLELTAAASAMGATTVAQGRLQVMGSLASPTSVNLGADLGGTGVIVGSVSNAGSVSPGALGALAPQLPKGQVMRQAVSPAALGTLTIKGDYSGNGGQLNIRTVLGSDDSPTDRLLIDGGKASGRTQVNVANQGGAGALTTGNGIQVVGLVNGASSTADAFNLGAPVVVGPFQYDLHSVGSEGWFLQSRDNSPAVPPVQGSQGGGAELPRVVAAASPEVSLNNAIGSMTQAFGLQTLGTRAARYAEADAGPPMAGDLSAARRGDALRKTSLQPGGDGPGAGEFTQNPERQGTHMWTRAFGEHGRVQGGGLQARGADFSYSSGGMQAGADLQVSRNGPIEDRVGGYAGFGNLHAEVRHFDGTLAGHNAMRAYAIGGYWGRTSEEGWYIDTVAQYTRYDKVRTMSVQGISSQTQGWGMAASVEAGKSFRLSPETSIEPQAQLIVQRTHLDDTRDSNATDIALGSANSVLGRLGARVVRKWFEPGSDVATHSTWLRLNAWQEFAGKSNATYQTANGPLSFGSNMRGTWGELELGFNASLSHSTSIFGTVGYQHSLGGTRREAASFSTGASTGGLAAMGLGLSMQLTPNARLTTKASYGNAAKGQPNAIAANVALDVKW